MTISFKSFEDRIRLLDGAIEAYDEGRFTWNELKAYLIPAKEAIDEILTRDNPYNALETPLTCPKCKKSDQATLTTTLCRDCGSPAHLDSSGQALAQLCRECCPTGHGEVEETLRRR